MAIPQRTIKLVVIGAAGVGKTSIRGQYISQRFSTGYRATIGADFITKVVQVDEREGSEETERVTLQIWDTAGQERFSSLSSAFFRGADAAVLVFDVNAPETLRALVKWWEEFKVHAPLEDDELGSFCCVVVGNKVDLGEKTKVSRVSYEQAGMFMDTLIPPELYRDDDDDEEEEDPLSASQMTATPTRVNAKPAYQPLFLASSSTSQSRSQSRSRSTDPSSTRSLYASSSISGLSIYHTPSSSVYHHYDTTRSSPDLSHPGSYPPRPLPHLIIGSLDSTRSLGSMREGNSSAVTLTPSNWDKFDSTQSGQDSRYTQIDDVSSLWDHREDAHESNETNGDVRQRYDSIHSVASSASAADSFFSAYSTHTPISNPSPNSSSPSRSSSRSYPLQRPSSSTLSWRPYPHTSSLAPPLKSPSHSNHSHMHSHNDHHIDRGNVKHFPQSRRSISPLKGLNAFPASSSHTRDYQPHLRTLDHSHLRSEIGPAPDTENTETTKIPDVSPNLKPDTGPRLFFVSAKTGEGVNDVFEYVAKRVVRRWAWEEREEERHREESGDFDGYREAERRLQPSNRLKRREHQRQPSDGIGHGSGIMLNRSNGLRGASNGGGLGGRSWSGGMTITLSSLNGVVGSVSSMRGMRGTGETEGSGGGCCST
ncbi:hypothetical protein F5879DRAFT_975184 [Lentinula edodes]|nr:hypothetical protein F5879DRAFT_975184 [Lentinula edodes]